LINSLVIRWLTVSLLLFVVAHVLVNGILLHLVSVKFLSTAVFIIEVFTLNDWIPHFVISTRVGADKNDASRSGKHEHNNNNRNTAFNLSGSWLEMSVFPNDVSWLRSGLNINYFTKELVVNFHVFIVFSAHLATHGLGVVLGSLPSLFGLEGDEYRAWMLKFVKNVLNLNLFFDAETSFFLFGMIWHIDHLADLIINFINFFVFFTNEKGTSLGQLLDDWSIVVREGNLGDVYSELLSFNMFMEAKVRHLSDSFLKLKLDVKLELGTLVDRVSLVIVFFEEFVVGIFVNVEFHRVVTSGDCFTVKIYEFGVLNATDVVKVDNDKEIDEDTNTGGYEACYLSQLEFSIWVNCIANGQISTDVTWELDEHRGRRATLLNIFFTEAIVIVINFFNVCEFNVARFLLVTFLELLSNELFFHLLSALKNYVAVFSSSIFGVSTINFLVKGFVQAEGVVVKISANDSKSIRHLLDGLCVRV